MIADAPPSASHRSVKVVENVRVARDTYRIRLLAPEMARAILPGQFLMIRPTRPGSTDPFFGRPFALYDTVPGPSGTPEAIDVVYLVLGRGTAALAGRRPGDRVEAWGPLGNGFGPPPGDGGPVTFVAGGIGQTPFLALGRWWTGRQSYGTPAVDHSGSPASSAELLYGVRSADLAAEIEAFEAAGIAVRLATDDGSAGHHGLVTGLLEGRLRRGPRPSKLVGCGPPPMLGALAEIADREGIPCDVSLENQMACGFGACFSCVVPIRQADGSTDLRRVCVEGPIVPASEVAWPIGGGH
ncbi:dihydroorotate dehydrogenase electron transfer subunit [Tautonia plasticadhaerens]|uniref:Dihydroorotate dehydrogenase B (NAD(+)), electron transfer subunit n=1 Tax=Tautonia plasticadhaerens TaxID=2527974 RepID=A0A518GWX3_9BACT|nr:dihydroorotate dehydrogenase electron transfer subunit [Tautonia plasticadhaerens]QDV33061.1 Dihydroorotate dehydrogenase B (NAD(+)), electron transfer subunit [Tautonia plasticadhaerens]